MAPAPAAANSAAVLPTTMRARRYVGKTTATMMRTSTYLIGRVRGSHVVDAPDRCDEVRVERVERVWMAALGRMAGCADGARQLRELELVAEEPRRHAPPRLEHVDGRQPDVDARERNGRQQAIGNRVVERTSAARRCRRAHSAAMPSGTACVTSISRRTKLHGTAARLHASSTASSRSFGADGMVTKTASGASRPTAQPMSSRPPTIETPWMRRRRSASSSSTKPTRARPASRAVRAAGFGRSARRRR